MWIAVGLCGFILVVIALLYNGLVAKKNMAENSFASIDVMLKKRYDLIPNLVETVKGYAKHERELFVRVTELRAKAASGRLSSDQTVAVNNELSKALFGVMAVVEDYPQLKANENFMQLQRALTEVEEQLSAARRAFNAAVTDLNNSIEMFPSNIMAGMMGYKTRQLFEAPASARANVDVDARLHPPTGE